MCKFPITQTSIMHAMCRKVLMRILVISMQILLMSWKDDAHYNLTLKIYGSH